MSVPCFAACWAIQRCETKRLKQLSHLHHICYGEQYFSILDSRLPKVMLFGQVKGSNPPGRPRKGGLGSGMTLLSDIES